MGQKVFTIQMFFIGVFGALLARDYLGTNFIVSLLVGFIGGGAVFGFMIALAPRIMFYGLVLFYAFGGFSIARSYEWSAIETIVITLVAGGLGWGANLRLAQDAYFSRTAAEPSESQTANINTKELLEHEDKSELFFDAARAYRSGFIHAKTYERVCRVIDAQAGGRKRTDQPTPVSEINQKPISEIGDDDQAAVVNLSELGLLKEQEWAESQRRLDKAIEAGAL